MAVKEAKTPKTTVRRYVYGTGRRKTAVARVRLYEKGKGLLIWNDTPLERLDPLITAPLELVGELGKWDVSVKVVGGGKYSQLAAIQLGVARALLEVNADYRQSLKKADLLSRDPREKERKKPGLKRARRAPQWAKR